MDVPTDVGVVHLEQHAQHMHEEIMPEMDQDEQQTMGNIELELPAHPNTVLLSVPQEGHAVCPNPQGLKVLSEKGEFARIQAAERLEGLGTLHEARHLKRNPTLAKSPQLRNGS